MPSATEAKMAIREATRMHQRCEDPYYIGKTILRQNYRIKLLEQVLAKAEAYILADKEGQAEAELVAAINRINSIVDDNKNSEQRIFIN